MDNPNRQGAGADIHASSARATKNREQRLKKDSRPLFLPHQSIARRVLSSSFTRVACYSLILFTLALCVRSGWFGDQWRCVHRDPNATLPVKTWTLAIID